MSDDHKVNEIGRWHQYLIYRDEMKRYMTKWLLTNEYDVDDSDYDEHIYFNYASEKNYINIKEKNVYITLWRIDIAPKGRKFLNKGEKHE